jgi:hypothetical protein
MDRGRDRNRDRGRGKDKETDRDRDRERGKGRDRDKEKDRTGQRHKGNKSTGKDRGGRKGKGQGPSWDSTREHLKICAKHPKHVVCYTLIYQLICCTMSRELAMLFLKADTPGTIRFTERHHLVPRLCPKTTSHHSLAPAPKHPLIIHTSSTPTVTISK